MVMASTPLRIGRLHARRGWASLGTDGRCSRLSVLKGIEKSVVNVLSMTEASAPFAGFDLLMSWGMEYALDDNQLQRLMEIVARNRVPYLMCSATTIAG
jgi:hypothetical protein